MQKERSTQHYTFIGFPLIYYFYFPHLLRILFLNKQFPFKHNIRCGILLTIYFCCFFQVQNCYDVSPFINLYKYGCQIYKPFFFLFYIPLKSRTNCTRENHPSLRIQCSMSKSNYFNVCVRLCSFYVHNSNSSRRKQNIFGNNVFV